VKGFTTAIAPVGKADEEQRENAALDYCPLAASKSCVRSSVGFRSSADMVVGGLSSATPAKTGDGAGSAKCSWLKSVCWNAALA
jgi:hypothetical protein